MNLHHISLKTKRLKTLYEFYMTYFCCSVGHKFVNSSDECYGYMLNFKGAGVLELLQLDKSIELCDITKKSFHFCVHVENLDDFLKIMPKKYLYSPPKQGRTDFVYQVMLVDPDGNLIEVHEEKVLRRVD